MFDKRRAWHVCESRLAAVRRGVQAHRLDRGRFDASVVCVVLLCFHVRACTTPCRRVYMYDPHDRRSVS